MIKVCGLISDLDERGMLEDTLVVAVGEFGRSLEGVSTSGGNSADGRDRWPYLPGLSRAQASNEAMFMVNQIRLDLLL